MFKYQEKENKKLGYKYKNYFLTQGDSFSLSATEKNASTEEPLISRVVFKLGLAKGECCKIESVFEQDYFKTDNGVWILKISGEDTSKWNTSCCNNDEPYVYEIEIYYTDGESNTITSGDFTVLPQIGGV